MACALLFDGRMLRGAKLLVVAGAMFAAGCKGKDGPLYKPGEDRCEVPALPDGAVLEYESGSGWAGDQVWSVVAFSDGQLVVHNGPEARVSPERISKLLADIEATAVKDEDEGGYWPRAIEWDAGGETLVLRDGAGSRMWSQSGSAESPEKVNAAFRVGDAFFKELEASGVGARKDG
jgi:hypothetical protein